MRANFALRWDDLGDRPFVTIGREETGERFMAEHVFVLGGDGFVGSHIVRACLKQGHVVTSFGPRMSTNLLADLNGTVHRKDGCAEDGDALLTALRESGATRAVWAAGYNADARGLMASGELDAGRAVAVNVGAWTNMLRAASQCGLKRVVACGSTVVFGASTDYTGAVREISAQLPRSVYGMTKSLAEAAAQHHVRQTGLSVVTLRLPLVFGPGRWYGGAATAIVELVQAAARQQSIDIRLTRESFDLMYVKDAANAVLRLLAADKVAATYNVNGFATNHEEIVRTLQQLRPGFQPSTEYIAAPWTYPHMSSALIEQEQGFRPSYTLEAALSDYLNEV